MKKLFLILLVAALWLAACAKNTSPPAEPIAEPAVSATATNTQPQASPTSVTVVMVTLTPTPTLTAPPASTATAKPTTKPTATAKPTTTPTATVKPAFSAIVTGDLVNLRSGPDTGYLIVSEVVLSQTLQIIGQNKDASWWQVCCTADDESGWIRADLLETDLPADEIAAAVPVIEFPPEMSGTVVGGIINLRQGPGTDYAQVGEIPLGDAVQIVARNQDNTWWQVCCPTGNGLTSWISPEFLVTNVSPQDALRRLPIATAAPESTATPESTPVSAGETPETNGDTPTDNPDASAPDATTAVTETPPTSVVNAEVTGDLVNLRGGPGTQFEIVGSVVVSDTVQIIGQNEAGNWWQVDSQTEDGAPAWIIAEFVSVSDAIGLDGVPVIDTNTPEATPETAKAAAAEETPSTEVSLPQAPGLPAVGSYAAPKTVNPLTGLPLAAEKQAQRPAIVCINNDPQARPQYGIGQADVMYEYLMEGYSITRFSGIFYGDSPTRIGPIRSARLINYYMAALYNAPLFCSGASDQVRFMLKNQAPFPYLDIDLDDPSNRRYSDSIGTDYRTRLNTSADYLARWKADWEIEEPAGIRGFTFGSLTTGGDIATTIQIPYPKVTGSHVSYTYSANGGRYLRYLDDDPHLDSDTGQQVAVENVLVQFVTHQQTDMVEDSLGNKGILLDLFEGGKAILFRDGQAFTGTWRSSVRGDMPHFYAEGGSEIPLKPGKTWISVVTPDFGVTYQ